MVLDGCTSPWAFVFLGEENPVQSLPCPWNPFAALWSAVPSVSYVVKSPFSFQSGLDDCVLGENHVKLVACWEGFCTKTTFLKIPLPGTRGSILEEVCGLTAAECVVKLCSHLTVQLVQNRTGTGAAWEMAAVLPNHRDRLPSPLTGSSVTHFYFWEVPLLRFAFKHLCWENPVSYCGVGELELSLLRCCHVPSTYIC